MSLRTSVLGAEGEKRAVPRNSVLPVDVSLERKLFRLEIHRLSVALSLAREEALLWFTASA
jgi:hypothetical protein